MQVHRVISKADVKGRNYALAEGKETSNDGFMPQREDRGFSTRGGKVWSGHIKN
jgi:hypothetical protein